MLDKEKILGVCGILMPIIAYSFIFLAILIAPWFSWTDNALSDLGVHQNSDIIFNSGLMISGLLLMIFSFGLYSIFEDRYSKIGAIILIFTALALFNIGVFPETTGKIHTYISVLFFILFPIGYFMLGLSSFKKRRNTRVPIIVMFSAFLAILIWFFPWKSFGIHGVAIPEFLSSLIGSIWLIYLGLKLYKKRIIIN